MSDYGPICICGHPLACHPEVRILWRENYGEWVYCDCQFCSCRMFHKREQIGFVTHEECLELMASRDLSTVEKLIAYECWKETDGSYEGLIKLPSLPFESEVVDE